MIVIMQPLVLLVRPNIQWFSEQSRSTRTKDGESRLDLANKLDNETFGDSP